MNALKKLLSLCIWCFGKTCSYIYPYSFYRNTYKLRTKLHSIWISKEFKSFGKNSIVQLHIYLLGGKYITIGNKTWIGTRAALTAWDIYGSDTFHPEIFIGNNVSIGDDSHITAINRIQIGNNVLTGKKITITDNSHGRSELEFLSFPPAVRPLYSAGPVIIEDGVWIGDKVTILSNVRIGKNAIIGANAVVTKDIPANCVAVGIPAKVIKLIEK
jgi:acetyltransferase-like isoleucine patch superfamily enzyme